MRTLALALALLVAPFSSRSFAQTPELSLVRGLESQWEKNLGELIVAGVEILDQKFETSLHSVSGIEKIHKEFPLLWDEIAAHSAVNQGSLKVTEAAFCATFVWLQKLPHHSKLFDSLYAKGLKTVGHLAFSTHSGSEANQRYQATHRFARTFRDKPWSIDSCEFTLGNFQF